MSKITEKQLKATIVELNHLAKLKALDYGFALTRSMAGYSIMQQKREPGVVAEKIQWGMSAAETHCFLMGAAHVMDGLPDVLF